MFSPHTKYDYHLKKCEVSTITCNEEMKGNAKCKNSGFEPQFSYMAHCRLHISDN